MTNFLETVLFFLAAALIIVPIFNRLGFGSVLGYLMAGIIVGPQGFNLIHHVEETFHFAEYGVIFLLFIIGLEIRPQKLFEMKKKLATLGLFQVILCSVVMTVAVKFFIDISWILASVVGFSLSLSSTAFALQTLEERNEFQTDYGQGAFSILLVQDLVAIPALAIIPMIWPKGSETTGPIWLFPFVLVGLYLLSRYLIRPLFRHLAATHQREIFTASALFIVLGVSAIMIKIGLSAALGAFIAGVFLAENEYRHELEANIEPFRGLLMGLFFISVGMGVSIDLILSRPIEILAVTLAYFLLKWGLIYLVGRREGMSHAISNRMGFYIAQGGEFAFVILGLIVERKLMLDLHIEFLGAMITLSMLMGPFLEKILEARKRIFSTTVVEEPRYDVIKDEHPEIIIGGFGRFGQMFGRVFRAQGIPFVAIDHDAGQIDLLRKFGNKVYFGDVSRLDLLRSAGAEKAKYFVLAIDEVDASIRTAQLVRQYFPHLKIFARARNRGHAFDLFEEGVTHVKRETFDSSVNFVGDLLLDMGFEKDRAHTIIEHFRRHDEAMMREQAKVRKDEQMFISVSKQGAAQLENVLKDESNKSYI